MSMNRILYHLNSRFVWSSRILGMSGPIQDAIERKITESLKPVTLSIVNESHKHAGHVGNPSKDPNAETHFDVTIESEAFKGKSRVQQHRMVYDMLEDEFRQGLHALALKTKPTS